MFDGIKLYVYTIRYLKPAQIFWRIGKHFGCKCTLKDVSPMRKSESRKMIALPELDFDPVFLDRFSTEELMQDKVTLLHESEKICWNAAWHVDTRTPLWNFNLHYFEYLHPLVKCYLDMGDESFLHKIIQMISGWIHQNPREKKGDGWSSYTISLRLTNWIAFLSAAGYKLDEHFRKEMEDSMFEQYQYLSLHLERDILGNHYFENLKTLILCALFFGDEKSLPIYLRYFRAECCEEILPDGMHFELSPMYHKIILEGLLRVTSSLQYAGMPDRELEAMVQKMLDTAFSMESGLSVTPLFNDSGDNVAKSLSSLLAAAKNHLRITPTGKTALLDSGYYFFEMGSWKLIVDAGQPGPDYIPGHSHCDAMSFELYHNGKPFLVNCGTYAYQCRERSYFRSTQSHNTVQVAGTEQSEIWSTFRLARRSRVMVLELSKNVIRMEMTDYKGNRIRRELLLKPDSLEIHDYGNGLQLCSHLHSLHKIEIRSNTPITEGEALYAPEFGQLQKIYKVTATGSGNIDLVIPLF